MSERKVRAARLRAAGEAAKARFFASQRGRHADVLVERAEGTSAFGHSQHFAPVRIADVPSTIAPGAIAECMIDGANSNELKGRVTGASAPIFFPRKRGPRRSRAPCSPGSPLSREKSWDFHSTMTDQATTEAPKRGWFQRLREGLSRSSSQLATGIGDIFTKRKLDDAALHELEELLIAADLGPVTAARLTANLREDALQPGNLRRGNPRRTGKRHRGDSRARGQAARHRPAAQAPCHPGRRRQWQRQDHHHRQARRAAARRWPSRDDGRRRYIPRRRHRSAQDLGRAHRRNRDHPRARQRPRRPRLRRPGPGQGRRPTTCC